MYIGISRSEGTPFVAYRVDLTQRQLVRRLNKSLVTTGRPSAVKLSGFNAAAAIGEDPLRSSLHAIRLPDGRIWDVVNGWR